MSGQYTYDYDAEKEAALERWSRRLSAIIEGVEGEKVVDFFGGIK